MERDDVRLIERGFPCHQVGAETQRERDTGKAPPTHRLHVWWARRPLTPSRAALIASLDRADTDPELFVRELGIEHAQALVNGEVWILNGDLLKRIECRGGREVLPVDAKALRALEKEQERRGENRDLIQQIKTKDARLAMDPVIRRWEVESRPLPKPWPKEGGVLEVQRRMGDPAWAKEKMVFTKAHNVRFPGDAYGYDRAFSSISDTEPSGLTVLDPTAGGGSIPFEALRLGHKVIANELNPVATTILYATLEYPAHFGMSLVEDISAWGHKLLEIADPALSPYHPDSGALPLEEQNILRKALAKCPEHFDVFNKEQVLDYIHARQVTCPHCGGEAPLLNTCYLSKEDGEQWGVRVVTDRKPRNGKVRFETYRAVKGKGPNGEDPDMGSVDQAVGQCVHCRQAIDGDEIKRQARGESQHGTWKDRLYAVVAVRYEPVLDKSGKPVRYASGGRKGEIKTRKVRFFRPPNERDLKALEAAEKRLQEKWPEWDTQGLIPTEKIPEGQKTSEPLRYGMPRWCDMFTPRQLLGHVTLVEGLNRLKPEIVAELRKERGKAVVTYLQFAIDKGLDYNTRQTMWHANRGVIAHAFTRHDFSLKWTFGEMIFTGPNSGAAWGVAQVVDAYRAIAELVESLHKKYGASNGKLPLKIVNGTAAYMPQVETGSVDLICMDPPYYDNVQYGELSDFFYQWQRRTLKDLYPGLFSRSLGVNTRDEAVANPVRDGSRIQAKDAYKRIMGEIFAECLRVLKDDGIMTLMFTHKSLDAWESLTRSIIENGWMITSTFPVESEPTEDIHHKDIAAAASSIFIACRKRKEEQPFPASWTGFGGQGVQHKIRDAVREGLKAFASLKLNPVDEDGGLLWPRPARAVRAVAGD